MRGEGFGFRVQGSGFRVQGLGCMVNGMTCVQDSVLGVRVERVSGLGFNGVSV